METFIVRIYRRFAAGSRDPAGTIEHVDTGERVGFADAKELLEGLLGAGSMQPRSPDADAGPHGGPEKSA